jgi:3-deoxy-D-manno-octulosonate 8-phosphate phosphatase (KDO 8-P phosphatase)
VTDLEPLLAGVRLAVFDFDGVFTDNRVWTNERGEESVVSSRSDGLGLRRLDEVGVGYVILSTEANPVVGLRARKLGAEVVQGVDDKLVALTEQAFFRKVDLDRVSYLGNDVNDADCLRSVGLPVVPVDAWPEVVPFASWVLSRGGGQGCVREFCDAVWRAQGGE